MLSVEDFLDGSDDSDLCLSLSLSLSLFLSLVLSHFLRVVVSVHNMLCRVAIQSQLLVEKLK